MDEVGFALWFSVIAAVLFAAVVTIVNRSTAGKIIGYLSCVVVAVAPLFGRHVVTAFAVAGLIMAAAIVVGRRQQSRQE